MLVARFPEFDRDQDRLILKLPPALWHDKSPAAKDLLSKLMFYDPERRMTAAEALRHEWLAEYRWIDEEVAGPGAGNMLSEEESYDESIGHKSSTETEYINSTTVSLRHGSLFPSQANFSSQARFDGKQEGRGYHNLGHGTHLPLIPLLQLQRYCNFLHYHYLHL